MTLQISTTIDLVNAGVSLYLAVRLFRASHQDQKSKTLHNFALTYTFLTLAYVLLTVPRLLASQQTALLGIAFAFGSSCFLLAATFFARIVLHFTRPAWSRIIVAVLHVAIAVGLVWALFQRAAPTVDSVTGITNWNVDLRVGAFSAIILLAILIPGAVLFFRQGMLAKDNHVVRVRSITIAVGIALLIFTAAIFYLANTETVAIIGDLASIGALLTVFLGVVYHRPTPLPPLPRP